MRAPSHAAPGALAALLLATMALGACDRRPPAVEAAVSASQPATAGGRDASVPDAASALPPGGAGSGGAAAERANGALTRAQESSAMPLPGQNNDHSAPAVAASAARRASGP
jgi:hypothetical protein